VVFLSVNVQFHVWLAFWVCLILLGQCFCAGKSLFVINSTFLRLSKHMLVCINPLVLLESTLCCLVGESSNALLDYSKSQCLILKSTIFNLLYSQRLLNPQC
jgi:hypothetical protein